MISKNIRSTILVGGCGRSGTSILGEVLGTSKDSEYLYDPAFIHKTMYCGFLNQNDYAKILQHYLYDEMLANLLAGRYINNNSNDLTFIGNFKVENEVKERMSKSWGREELLGIIEDFNLIFKVTDSVFYQIFENSIKGLKKIFIIREPMSTISSIVKKGWFDDKSLLIETPEPLISTEIYDNLRIPSFVQKTDYDYWISADIIDRSAYYYHLSLSKLSEINNCVVVSYDLLVHKPLQTVIQIYKELGLQFGGKTETVINKIHPQIKQDLKYHHIEAGLLDSCENVYHSQLNRSIIY